MPEPKCLRLFFNSVLSFRYWDARVYSFTGIMAH